MFIECDRCGMRMTEEEIRKDGDQSYCEDCYDDLFVSWKEAYETSQSDQKRRVN